MAHIKQDLSNRFWMGKSEQMFFFGQFESPDKRRAIVRFVADPSKRQNLLFNIIEVEETNISQTLTLTAQETLSGDTNSAIIPIYARKQAWI